MSQLKMYTHCWARLHIETLKGKRYAKSILNKQNP